MAEETVEEFTCVLRHSFVFESLVCLTYPHPGEGLSVGGGRWGSQVRLFRAVTAYAGALGVLVVTPIEQTTVESPIRSLSSIQVLIFLLNYIRNKQNICFDNLVL